MAGEGRDLRSVLPPLVDEGAGGAPVHEARPFVGQRLGGRRVGAATRAGGTP
jgi:hypothetical protein